MRTTLAMPAFKEWSGVCSALEAGLQTILLRKGGISEDHGKFAFLHTEFYLFPTFFHQQTDKTRLPASLPIPSQKAGEHIIRLKAKVTHTSILHEWEKVQALAPFHFWTEEVIRERFSYDEANVIHLAIVRVYRIEPELIFPDAPEFGGCKSWIEIPSAAGKITPVISDNDFENISHQIQKILS